MGHGGAAGESLSWGGLEALHLPSRRAGARGQATQERPCPPNLRVVPNLGASASVFFLISVPLCVQVSVSHCLLQFLLSCLCPPLPPLYSARGAAPVRDRVPRMEGGFSREVLSLGLGSQNDRIQLPTLFAKHPHQAPPVLGVLGARAALSLLGGGGRGAHPQNCSVGS